MNKKHFFVSLIIIVCFFVSGCSSAQAPATPAPTQTHTPSAPASTDTPQPTQGNGKYTPPQGVYACDFHSDQAIQGRLNEYYGGSTFQTVESDDFGYWMSVMFRRIDDQYLPVPTAVDEREKYLDLDLSTYMEHRIKPQVPGAKIIEQEYLQQDTPILLAIIDLPGGSNMIAGSSNGNEKHLDAVGGYYFVIHGAYSYIINTLSTQFTSGANQDATIQDLKSALAHFYKGCSFQDDPTAGKNFVQPTLTPMPSAH